MPRPGGPVSPPDSSRVAGRRRRGGALQGGERVVESNLAVDRLDAGASGRAFELGEPRRRLAWHPAPVRGALARPGALDPVFGAPDATCRSLRSSARATGVVAQEIGTRPRSNPVTNTTCHSRPLARWNVTRSTPAPFVRLATRSRGRATKRIPRPIPARSRRRGTHDRV